jgi:hypothetical protein
LIALAPITLIALVLVNAYEVTASFFLGGFIKFWGLSHHATFMLNRGSYGIWWDRLTDGAFSQDRNQLKSSIGSLMCVG